VPEHFTGARRTRSFTQATRHGGIEQQDLSAVTQVSPIGGSLSSSYRRSRLRYTPALPTGIHPTSRFRVSRGRRRASGFSGESPKL
jgi:hypothetical protein